MIFLKTDNEIQIIREGGLILGKAHAEVAKILKPGITTEELDKKAFEFIKDNGAEPSFKGYNGFPASLCISVNEQIVHGIPGKYVLQEGDLISIDCGVFFKGFHSDSAYSYGVGNISSDIQTLLDKTKESLYLGIEQAIVGNRLGDVGFAIQEFVEKNKFSVVRELVGHGIGKKLHEPPEVPNYGKRGKGIKLEEGLILAIEPMVNFGKKHIVQEDDGWTVRTADRSPSAHFEHTVAVRRGKAEILTTFEFIEEVLNRN